MEDCDWEIASKQMLECFTSLDLALTCVGKS